MDDPQIKSIMHLFPDWNERLLKDALYEASQPHIKLLEDQGRSAVWEVCGWFGCSSRGVPGVACQLLERYLFIMTHNPPQDARHMQNFQKTLITQLHVLVACCVMLASKMNTGYTLVNAKTIHMMFTVRKLSSSIKNILAFEHEIYRALGFRIPLWSGVEIGEMLALEVGVPLNMMNTIAMVVDVAEFRRNRINKTLRSTICMLQSPMQGDGVLTLHLIGGAVATVAPLLPTTESGNIESKLAALINVSVNYICCVRDAVHAVIFSRVLRNIETPSNRV